MLLWLRSRSLSTSIGRCRLLSLTLNVTTPLTSTTNTYCLRVLTGCENWRQAELGSNKYTDALIRIAYLLLGDSTDSTGPRDRLQSRADRDSTQPPRGSACKERKTEKKKYKNTTREVCPLHHSIARTHYRLLFSGVGNVRQAEVHSAGLVATIRGSPLRAGGLSASAVRWISTPKPSVTKS